MTWTNGFGKRTIVACVQFSLMFFALIHFALPIWVDVVTAAALLLIVRSIKQAVFVSLVLVAFSFAISLTLGRYGSDQIFYREHEKWSNNGTYVPNVSDVIDMPYGDLYAIGKNSFEGSIDSIREQRRVEFRTDKYGFRNDRQISDAQLILVGDSFIVANGTDQNHLPSVWLEKLSGVAVANVAHPGDPKHYERILLNVLNELDSNASFLVFYFEGNDFNSTGSTVQTNIDRPSPLLSIAGFYNWLEANKDRYLKSFYPSDQTFFRVIRRSSLHLNEVLANVAKEILVHMGALDSAGVSKEVITRSIGSYEVGFFKPHIEATESRVRQTYIFKDENVTKRIKAVFFIPTKWRVYSKWVDGNPSSTAFDFLKEHYSEQGIPVYDLTYALEREAQKLLQEGKYVFWRDDTHWNGIGIEVSMKEVVRILSLGKVN